jgi:Bacterial low temperature requirement A protein (LtrA)
VITVAVFGCGAGVGIVVDLLRRRSPCVGAPPHQGAEGRERNALARDSYSYLHFPMAAGIVLVAVGLENTVHHVDEALGTVAAFALLGGVTLYLLAMSRCGCAPPTRSTTSGSGSRSFCWLPSLSCVIYRRSPRSLEWSRRCGSRWRTRRSDMARPGPATEALWPRNSPQVIGDQAGRFSRPSTTAPRSGPRHVRRREHHGFFVLACDLRTEPCRTPGRLYPIWTVI